MIDGLTPRKFLYDALSQTGYEVAFVGKSYRQKDFPYFVIKKITPESSLNTKGRFERYEVLCYVPDSSIERLDEIIELAKTTIATKYSRVVVNSSGGEDYHDETINMIMNYFVVRFPTTVRWC